jgi:hypothetical protein
MSLAWVTALLLQTAPATPPATTADRWSPVRFMEGEWTGESGGQPGKGTVRRTYRFVLGGKFLHEENVSIYPPQPKNEKGEVHEHRSFFSYDRARRTLVFRQFHQEGFVNQYVMTADSPAGSIVFESEAIENVAPGWKARETYQVVSPDEFVETFELSSGGAPYEVYSQARLKRVRPAVSASQAPARAATPKELKALRFLLGDWRAEGGGTPGEAGGGFAFASSVQDRVIMRTSFAEYPASAGRPASRHDDLLVLYATEPGELRGDYYDSEGHVIRYAGDASSPGELLLVSEIVSGAPRFRLSYKLRPDGSLDGRFEVAPPGKPEAFGPYLAWTARRLVAGR